MTTSTGSVMAKGKSGSETGSNAMHQPDLGVPGLVNTGFNNQTLRQIVHISAGGHWVRVRLSTFGASGLLLGAAHLALGVRPRRSCQVPTGS